MRIVDLVVTAVLIFDLFSSLIMYWKVENDRDDHTPLLYACATEQEAC
jgi:hypothetical protein